MNGLCWILSRSARLGETGRITLRNGLFCGAIRAVLKGDTARFVFWQIQLVVFPRLGSTAGAVGSVPVGATLAGRQMVARAFHIRKESRRMQACGGRSGPCRHPRWRCRRGGREGCCRLLALPKPCASACRSTAAAAAKTHSIWQCSLKKAKMFCHVKKM